MTGNPNYADLQSIYNQIKANSASVPITLGGSRHGHLGLATDTVTYSRITPNNNYLCPTHPAPFGVNNGTAAQIIEGILKNNIAITTFHKENHIERTTINQVQVDLDESVLIPKINKDIGVLDYNIINLMKYLFNSYGNIYNQKLYEKTHQNNSSLILPQLPHIKCLKRHPRLLRYVRSPRKS